MSSRVKRGCPVRPPVLIVLILILLAALVLFLIMRSFDSSSAQSPLPSVTESLDPSLSPPPMTTETPGRPSPTSTPSTEPEPEPEPETPAYDFAQPVPESGAVEDSYFDDAVFVGDSRTAGFMMYSGVPAGDSLTHTGLSIFDVQNGKQCIKVGKNTYTLPDALALKQYGKIYLCLGVNELGYNNDDLFYQAFCQLVDQIRIDQPDAVIYLQTLIPLNEEVIAESGGKSYLKNDHLRVYNELIAKVAADKQVALVDVYSAFADESGALPADASNDGVHLNKSYCVQWLDYLKTPTVSYDTLYPEGAETE